MFRINPFDPTDIKLVGKPVSSGGEFPVSLSVSPVTGDGQFTPTIQIHLNNVLMKQSACSMEEK